MVYIFFVQPGDMMTFDSEISIMQSVRDLKDKITEKCRIPQEQQVLLINGGEPLDPDKNLCSYMAGTDTNPIYLFSTNYDISMLDILRNLNFDDNDIKKRLVDCLSLPISLTTVTIRTLIAQDFSAVAKQHLAFCEKMVHEQHLQQQGWAAVIANLEDIVCEFKKRWEIFVKVYEEFIADRDTYDNLLESFDEDRKILQQIPIIDTLLETSKEPMDGSKVSETTTSTSETEPVKEISLFDWISSFDRNNSLDEMFQLCKTNLSKFEREIMPSLNKKVTDTLEMAEKRDRKEIDGLEKRLRDLEDLLRKIKKNVGHQSDMAKSFLKNQTDLASVNDNSILPDLCASHIHQMDAIKMYHQKIMEDRGRIVKAKHELSKSLCARIGWVQNVEEKLWELDSLLVYFHEHLQRLRKHLDVFRQLHMAPVTYMNAVVEVVRRRSFSQIFLLWASDLACQQLTIHNEEVTRRKDFTSQFEGHFLNSLFPGMGDVPPPFAIEAPPMFDAKLPKIDEEDVDKLRRQVPDFADSLTVPDMSHAIGFFTAKIPSKGKEDKVDDATAVEERLIQAVSDVGLASHLDKNLLKATGSETSLVSAPGLPHLKDDKGCESETDTDEFEKVGQSPLELNFPQGVATGAVPKATEKQDASTSTEGRNQSMLPPKKPPRSFRATQSFESADPLQRTLSISTNESFTNIKNISLDSIDELSSIKNFTSASDSSFNSHYNQSASKDQLLTSTSNSSLHLSDVTLSTLSKNNVTSHYQSSSLVLSRSKSVSPQSPRDALFQEGASPYQLTCDFATDEFYIDESLPSSVGTGNSQGSEFVRQLDTANIVVAMLQDNLQISRSEHDKLKETFLSLSMIAKMAAADLRNDLNEFKARFVSESRELSRQYETMGGSWESVMLEVDRNEKEVVRCMRRENDEEKQRFRYCLMEKEECIRKLEEDKRALEDRIKDTCRQLGLIEEELARRNEESSSRIEELLRQLHEKDVEKEKCLKELNDNLKAEHRAEIDNIKSRFKLIQMEKSPSLTSLEKEKSGDYSSLPSNSTLLLQITDNFELDKEKALSDERKKWEKLLEDKLKEQKQRFDVEKESLSEEVIRRMTEDKERQIDVFREHEKNLKLEVVKLKTTIEQLAEHQQESKKERDELAKELERLKASTVESGVAFLSDSEIQQYRVTGESCRINDVVLVLWDHAHQNFRIFQAKETKHAYFVHWDSWRHLGLSVTDGKPNKVHCLGQVVDKEICQVLKADNRFNVPKDTKFLLVKLKGCAPSSSSSELVQSQSAPSTERLAIDASAIETDSELARIDMEASRIDDSIEPPPVPSPGSLEKQLAGDSGIADVERVAVAAQDGADRVEDDVYWSTVPEQHQNDPTEAQQVEELIFEELPLQEELKQIQKRPMSASVALCEGDASTNPLAASPAQTDLSKSETLFNRPHRLNVDLNIDSCQKGDVVLILWDQSYENFRVLQESEHIIHILRADSLESLGLTITDGKPNKTHSIGRVVAKEYCKIKKSKNRYNIPKGTKFVRVKVKPLSRDSSARHFSVTASQSAPPEEERPDARRSSGTTRMDSESSRIEVLEEASIEEATVAVENNDRFEDDESCIEAVVEQSTYVSTNWLEAMFRSMFSK